MNGGEELPLRPQVVMRGDEYALINIDVSGFTELQRLGVGMMVWDQVRTLMEARGLYRARDPRVVGASGIGTADDIDFVVASLLTLSKTTVNRVRPRLLERPDLVTKLVNGDYSSLKTLASDLGMKVTLSFFQGGGKSKSKTTTSHFGQGDKFDLVLSPLRSYLRAWKKRDFRYSHINPKEAQRRVKLIDEVLVDLTAAKEDLVARSQVATYRAPSEKRRENK